MRVTPDVFGDAEALGAGAARLVADRLASTDRALFLLGCPSGRTGGTTYGHLARLVTRGEIDLSRLVIVMMDDYVAPGEHIPPRLVDASAGHSCRRYARREIVDRFNRTAPGPARVTPDRLWLPDPAAPMDYDRRIADAGGIGVFLLASGASDGHVAFNPPGSARDSLTRIIDLPESTRRDNLATFPSFGADLAAVPTRGVSVGLATIADSSACTIMLVHGSAKSLAARRLIDANTYEPDFPATIVTECRDPHLFLDRAAYADPHEPAATGAAPASAVGT